jgi:divalent metal cation (Fe/Co/Zn/Cd) transporter
LIILYTGIEIIRAATEDLMATLPGKKLARDIKVLLRPLQGIKAVEEVYAHRFGPYLVVNLTIAVEGSLTVTQGDDIATRAEMVLLENIEFMRRVYVHYHPVRPDEGVG